MATAHRASADAIAAGRAIDTVLACRSVDLVHLHGLAFDRYLPAAGVPVLATVHLPRELLLARLDAIDRPDTWLHGVSHSQQDSRRRRTARVCCRRSKTASTWMNCRAA